MKVAIVCSWLNQYGGAERVLEVLHAMYPEAPIYTSLFRPEALPTTYRDWNVRASPLQHVPGAGQHHQWLLPFYPSAFEHMNLSDYDLVISVPSAFAHGVRTGPNTLHICYCLTPARFLWDYDTYVQREDLNPLARHMLPFVISRLREWDRKAADHVDRFVGISHIVQHRIQECYQRRAEVIYPPTEVGRIPLSQEHGDYFLVISRLVPYKRIDLAVQAFNQLELPLVVIGDGRDRPTLQAMARPNVRFLGHVSDQEASHYRACCRAFIFPGEEDFGLAPIEAQAAGRPVIAYAGGGALETVTEGVTGLFFDDKTPDSLAATLLRFDERQFDPVTIRQNALRFDRPEFERAFGEYVRNQFHEFSAHHPVK